MMTCRNELFVATDGDISHLHNSYKDRNPYYGDLHDHCADGLRKEDGSYFSDGKREIKDWLPAMDALKMDFQTFLNHKQVYHMYLPQWDDTRFIGGTEPATKILDSKAQDANIHYNLITPDAYSLEQVLMAVEKYNYTGGRDGLPVNMGRFDYVKFTLAEFQAIIADLKSKGGMFVHPHPKQVMVSDDPLDYWFADYTGIEVFYEYRDSQNTKDNYKLWTDLLALGKRVWATAGCDLHNMPNGLTPTTVYAQQCKWPVLVSHLAKGDLVCGGVGIRMTVGDTLMGGHTEFAGKRVVLSVGDFHASLAFADHTYRCDIITDSGVVYSAPITTDMNYFAFDADENARFYRVEIHDEMENYTLIAIGNPIWND